MGDSIEVIFQPDGKRGRVAYGTTVLEAAKLLGVDITSVCGGKTSCGKCKIVVEAGAENLSAPTEAERELLSENELKKGYRLACAAEIRGNTIVVVLDESRTGRQRLQTEGIKTPVKLDPLVVKISLSIPEPSLKDQRADADRLLSVLHKEHGLGDIRIRHGALKKLPLALRDGDWTVTVTLWNGREIIDVERGVTVTKSYGFAVDIGTTKMAGYLMDLNAGKLVSVGSLMNPQIPLGEDVMTRITYAMKGPEALGELHEVVARGINQILEEACKRAGVPPEEVYETTIVGNTAMHHLFLGVDPKFVALSPYTPVIERSMDVETSKLDIKANPSGNVHVLPVIAGFVGADCVANILATEVYKSSELCFMIDVGTNTEIVVGNKESLVACSCASGPAFEGAHIKHGMRAATGAIERIWIDPDILELEYLTIDKSDPRGICGSAMIDALAEMLKAGIMDTTGRILTELDHPRVRVGPDGSELVIAWGEETATGEDIVLTQSDIRELQKAKAAMYTGASTLMRRLGVTVDNISRVFVAGAFGSYIDPASARDLGVFPDFPLEKVRQVGNAAGTGARMALLSREARQTADEIRKMVRYIELAADPDFEKEYMSAMFFPHLDFDRFPMTMKTLRKSRLCVALSHQRMLKKKKKPVD